MQRILDDERPQALVPLPAEHVEDEWMHLRVLAARTPAAEAAGADSGPLAGPAVQTPSRAGPL